MAPKLAAIYRRLYSGVNYRLRSAAGGRMAAWCRPASIILLITERCNAKCVHCDIWKNRGQEASPSVAEWKTMLRDTARWLGPVHVALSGGEALLRPYTPELVACGAAAGLFVEVLTHGYWQDQTRIEQLALARPGRITISLDGLGATHSRIRGKEKFWDYTEHTIQNLRRIRAERKLGYAIRLKTVVMQHNLNDLAGIAHFAAANGLEVFYQPIEQNYNTAEDAKWFEHSDNWPRDTALAVQRVDELIALKKQGLPIVNSLAQLQVMIPYFRDPGALRVSVQGHSGHERQPLCAALTTLQVQSNGDVLTCSSASPVGNIKRDSIRTIWQRRPHWWQQGCCLSHRCGEAEKERSLTTISH